MGIIIPNLDAYTYRKVHFMRQYGNRALKIANIGLQGKDNSIEARFRESKFIENENVAYILGIADSVIINEFDEI